MACNILYFNTNDQRRSCVPATTGFAKKLCLLSTDSNVPEMFYKVNVKSIATFGLGFQLLCVRFQNSEELGVDHAY